MNQGILKTLIFLLFILGGCGQKDSKNSDEFVGTGDTAIDGLTAAIRNTPNDASLYAQRATFYYQKEGYDEAIKDLKKALLIDSTNAEYYHLLADVQLDYYRSFEAIQTIEKVLRIYPESMPSLQKLSEFQYLLEQYNESINTANRMLKLDPQNADAYFMIGVNLRELDEPQKAINALQRTVELNPDIVDAWLILGQMHAENDSPLAKRYFDSALEIEPENIEVLHAKAFYLMEQEQLEESIALFRNITRIDPQYDLAYFNVGLLYLDIDSIQNAYEQFQIVTKISPTNAKAYYYSGVALGLMRRNEAAKQNFEQALRFDPNLEEAKRALSEIQ